MRIKLFRFSQKEVDETYSAELRTLPSFGDVQICCNAQLDYSYMSEYINADEAFLPKMKEIAITDMVNDFFERVLKEIDHAKANNNA